MADSLFTPTDAATDLHRLEKTLQQLVVDYELFFAARADGKINVLPPHRRIAETEAILKHYVKHPPHRTVDRFRFNTLVHRYRTNTERWRRRMKKLEEQGLTRAAADADSRQIQDLSRPQVLAATRLRQGKADGAQLRDIFLAYRGARRARGLPVAELSYSPFAGKLSARIEEARERSPGRDLELRVDEVGGQVRVAVRAVAPRDAEDSAAAPVADGETHEV